MSVTDDGIQPFWVFHRTNWIQIGPTGISHAPRVIDLLMSYRERHPDLKGTPLSDLVLCFDEVLPSRGASQICQRLKLHFHPLDSLSKLKLHGCGSDSYPCRIGRGFCRKSAVHLSVWEREMISWREESRWPLVIMKGRHLPCLSQGFRKWQAGQQYLFDEGDLAVERNTLVLLAIKFCLDLLTQARDQLAKGTDYWKVLQFFKAHPHCIGRFQKVLLGSEDDLLLRQFLGLLEIPIDPELHEIYRSLGLRLMEGRGASLSLHWLTDHRGFAIEKRKSGKLQREVIRQLK